MTTSSADVIRVDPSAFSWDTASDATPGVAEGVRRVVAAASSADSRDPLNEQTLLSLRHSGLSESSLWIAATASPPASSSPDSGPDSGPVNLLGFALVDAVPASLARATGSAEMAGPVTVDLVVDPSSRGHGVGRALTEEVLVSFPEVPMTAWSHGNHPAAAALASTCGFRRVRDLWVMRRPMSVDLPPVRTPDHIVVRPFEPGRDEDSFLAVNAAAFTHHPEQGDLSRADLDLRMAEPWFDPAGFFLAHSEDGELLGFHWTKVHDEDQPYGEVYVVGVSPAAQGLGLGKVLTLVGLHHLHELGLSEVILYVESENTPAVAVYERLGFTHADEDTDVMYSRRLTGRL